MEARSNSARKSGLRRKRRLWIGAGVAAFAALTALRASAQNDERTVDKVADKVHTVDQSVEAYVSGKTIDVQYYRELRIEDVGPVQASAGIFYNESRDLVGIFDALVYLGDEARQREIEVSVGARVFAGLADQTRRQPPNVRVRRLPPSQGRHGIRGGIGQPQPRRRDPHRLPPRVLRQPI